MVAQIDAIQSAARARTDEAAAALDAATEPLTREADARIAQLRAELEALRGQAADTTQADIDEQARLAGIVIGGEAEAAAAAAPTTEARGGFMGDLQTFSAAAAMAAGFGGGSPQQKMQADTAAIARAAIQAERDRKRALTLADNQARELERLRLGMAFG